MRFVEKLREASRKNNSLLCVGLDTELEKIPQFLLEDEDPTFEFNRRIIEATCDLVCAYKPNLAFYQAQGPRGLDSLSKTIEYIPREVPIIVDAKLGDIGNTSRMYAKFVFEVLGGDAVTVNPYLGGDALQPFLDYEDKGVFVLCLNSNQGAKALQGLSCEGKPLYLRVAEEAAKWNVNGNCGLVVGATYPEDIKAIRDTVPEMPFLIPGLGSQGGDLEKAVSYGSNSEGELAIINSSRSIIYASAGEDFAQAARRAALDLRDKMNLINR